MIRMGIDESVAKAALDESALGWPIRQRQAEDIEGPSDRIGQSIGMQAADGGEPGQMGEQHGIDVAGPRDASSHRGQYLAAGRRLQQAGRMDRSQHVLGGRSPVRHERHRQLAVLTAKQSMGAAGEADPVALEPVAEARLGHTPPGLDFVGEGYDIGEKVGVHLRSEPSGHGSEQNPRTPGRRIARENTRAERDAPSGSNRSGMEQFELSQEHAWQP